MAVDSEAEGAGDLLGPEENIDDDVLSNLLSASWPTAAVVDDKYGRYPWTFLERSIVEQRFDAVDSRRMTSIRTTVRGMNESLYAVPKGTVTFFPFLRSREERWVRQVLRHLAARDFPPEVGDRPHFSWEYYPGSPPKLGEVGGGFQSNTTNVGPTPYGAHVAETCLKFAVGQISGRVTMSNVHAALPTEVKRVKTRMSLRPIRGRSRWPWGQLVLCSDWSIAVSRG